MENDAFFEQLLKELPPIFARSEVKRLTGGLVCPGTLGNADSAGCGIKNRLLIGRHTAYTREDLVEWLKSKTKNPINSKRRTTKN